MAANERKDSQVNSGTAPRKIHRGIKAQCWRPWNEKLAESTVSLLAWPRDLATFYFPGSSIYLHPHFYNISAVSKKILDPFKRIREETNDVSEIAEWRHLPIGARILFFPQAITRGNLRGSGNHPPTEIPFLLSAYLLTAANTLNNGVSSPPALGPPSLLSN